MKRRLLLLVLAAVLLPPHLRVAHAEPGPHKQGPPAMEPDTRVPVPLLAFMAERQRKHMRDHLAAVQEIVASVAAKDFEGVAASASRMGVSEDERPMFQRMGKASPAFKQMAMGFHQSSRTIVEAAKKEDEKEVLTALSATMSLCVACHATFKQEVVDEAKWKELTGGN